jgi:ABC-type antimicrobial peptide transport system permease subunit
LDKRLSEYQATPEPEYFAEQSQSLTTFIKVLGIFVTVIFSMGAAIGAMITMYSEVANRTVEIGTMRALGFGRRSVLTVFLLEAILISLIGGAIGIVLSSFLQFISITTLNYSSFSDLTFSFAMTASTVQASIIFAIIMGFVGGFLPSARAARLNIVSALRGG